MRVLVIEDDVKVGRLLEQILREEGYEVEWAQDGQEGISMGLEGRYDLILLDYMLPTRSGPQVAQELRANGRTTPILMLTARDAPEDIRLCLSSGVNDYLTKPFRFDDLLEKIGTLAGRVSSGGWSV
jgi:DNA-binding response OmpR family regulator